MTESSDNSFDFRSSLRYLLIALSIFIISLLLTGDRSNKQLKIGQLWTGNDLVATKDISIQKSNEEIQAYKKSQGQTFGKVVKFNEVDIHELGAKIFGDSEERMGDGVLIKELITRLYNIPIVQDEIGPDFYRYENGQTIPINLNNTQKLSEAKIKFKRDIMGNSHYEAGLEDLLEPNYLLDSPYQVASLEETVNLFSKAVTKIEAGETIIKNDELITLVNKPRIDAYQGTLSSLTILSGIGLLQYLGYLILTSLIIIILILYLREYYPELFNSIRGVSFVLFWPVLFGIFIWLVKGIPSLSPFMIPFCIVPIVVKNFFSERLALFIHIVVVLIASYLTGLGYEFTFIQILAGVVTVLVVSETRHWSKFFMAIGLILATYALGFLGINLIQAGSEVMSDLPVFAWLLVNGFLLLLAYPFIPIVERIFGFTSSISLVELADMNNPLLKELATKAPGTLQHSLQVANLSEAATDAIGGNSLLVRTAALYHDIGKTVQPKYFIENAGGQNFHSELGNNFESAKIIIDHVRDGINMAKKAKLPKEILRFIETHHGDTRVEYFYRNQKNENPDQEFDESLFRYPGPLPTTKEETIMFLADSVEAACKSLKNPTEPELNAFVDKIIQFKIDNKQMLDSDLSYHELDTVTKVFKKLLKSIYHVRVEYPEENKPSEA